MTKSGVRTVGGARRWGARVALLAAVLGASAAFGGQVPARTTAVPGPEKAAFLELGSEGCVPCEAMKPVMQAVRDRFGDRIEVVFYDVRKNRSIGREWGIRLIPTQIFLKPDGSEFFRHEGFFPLEEVEKVLAGMGIR
ncbi:MAG: thioredoxin family protein [Deferrisomatales bacterium]